MIGVDRDGVCRGLAYLRLDNTRGLFTSTAMQSQRLPIPQSDAIAEILPFQVLELLQDMLNGDESPIPLDEMDAKIQGFRKFVKLPNMRSVSAG